MLCWLRWRWKSYTLTPQRVSPEGWTSLDTNSSSLLALVVPSRCWLPYKDMSLINELTSHTEVANILKLHPYRLKSLEPTVTLSCPSSGDMARSCFRVASGGGKIKVSFRVICQVFLAGWNEFMSSQLYSFPVLRFPTPVQSTFAP